MQRTSSFLAGHDSVCPSVNMLARLLNGLLENSGLNPTLPDQNELLLLKNAIKYSVKGKYM